jgi:allophanate hydrolase
MTIESLEIPVLTKAYQEGTLTPEAVLSELSKRIVAQEEKAIWIHRATPEDIRGQLYDAQARRRAGEDLLLFGIPFAVKDNIDVAGMPTTAGCPAFAYTPRNSAPVVKALLQAGAICLGKTNLDQFATGLVGTRSPYGACASSFDRQYISGGSSSGSALAVANGLASFALGTDTAGSGRVPAAFNNIVGLKPTRGLVSTRGVVPACRTLDCVSVFAGTVADSISVLNEIAVFDSADPYSRVKPLPAVGDAPIPGSFRFGIPRNGLVFFKNSETEELFEETIKRMITLGGTPVDVDYAPFKAAGELLYSGPWLAERYAAIEELLEKQPDAINPVVYKIIAAAKSYSAVSTFKAYYRLAELMRDANIEWGKMDVMLAPTAGTTYRLSDIDAEPTKLNSNLGYYTNFVNLMDLCAISVPAGFDSGGLPFGVSLIGRAFNEAVIASIADRLHRSQDCLVGATGIAVLAAAPCIKEQRANTVYLAVVGAHLSGMPLNGQLTGHGARLVREARTSKGYSLYALPDTVPPKPGLARTGASHEGIEVEVWELSTTAFGEFVAEVPPPLTIGTVTLEDGTSVKGFLSEHHAIVHAKDISSYGGWRNWMNESNALQPARARRT